MAESDIQNEKEFKDFLEKFDETKEQLELKSEELLVPKYQSIYLAECYFVKGKVILFLGKNLLPNYLDEVIKTLGKALSYQTPRSVIYTVYYIYAKILSVFSRWISLF